ncbi:MAG: hypothetical protein KA765_05540 [Thermoflexales bacterium]|nr:hypothetical protein [Thermoflexales bacterium]
MLTLLRALFLRMLLSVVLVGVLSACAAPTATPRPAAPAAASTVRPFPDFGPTRTATPTRTPRPTATDLFPATIGVAEVIIEPTVTSTARAAVNQPIGSAATRRPSGPSGAIARDQTIARSDAPAILNQALREAGVRNPNVYWFTFDAGDREVALMIQYDSPLRWQPGYLDMFRAAQHVIGRYFLAIEPPIYSAFVAGQDMTGNTDITARLRRSSAEKLARGDISETDFVNNYFEYVNLVVTCSADGCLAQMATPFPTFNFPFPFWTPTPASKANEAQ